VFLVDQLGPLHIFFSHDDLKKVQYMLTMVFTRTARNIIIDPTDSYCRQMMGVFQMISLRIERHQRQQLKTV
jgi:hypothetical protein